MCIMSTKKERKVTKGDAHLPRDDLVLSLESLILAYDIPDANCVRQVNPNGPRRFTRGRSKGGGGERTGARSVG
jgi:hypothetical protein